jgi:hypothetical protein
LFSDFNLVFNVIDFAFRVGLKLNVPEIVFTDFGIHPTEDLMGELLFEIGSGLDEGLKAPAN